MSVELDDEDDTRIIKQACLYYYATDVPLCEETADDGELLQDRLIDLIGDAVTLAHQKGFDVFNAWTLMDNMDFLDELRVRLSGLYTKSVILTGRFFVSLYLARLV